MKIHVLFVLGVMLFATSSFSQQIDHVQGEILVQLEEDVNPRNWIKKYGFHRGKTTEMSVRDMVSRPMNIYALKFNFANINEREMLSTLLQDPSVQNAQFNHYVTLRSTTPDDARFGDQWQYINTGQSGGTVGADIDMDLAWDTTTGGLTADGDEIVICVVDDGIDLNHSDMMPNLWVNENEIPNNNIDDDNNGYVDDYLGWDTGSNSDAVGDGGGHGTPVAGIVGAKGNNANGVAGVNWDVKVMIVQGGTGVESEVLEAYSYPLSFRKKFNETNGEEGAFVVATNSSWGVDFGQASNAPLWCAFYDEMGEQGILSAGATINGNNNVDVDGDLPTTCPSEYMIAVTNMNHNDQKVTGAGYGSTHIDLGAFGEGTFTVAFGNSYGGFGGTSGATPHVAGTIGLLYSAPCPDLIALAKSNPAAAAAQVRDYIFDGVDANTSLQGITVTEGRLNVNNSMQLLMNNCNGCFPPLSGTTTNIMQTSAVLNWTSSSEVNTVNLRWREIGGTTWTDVSMVSSPYTLSELTGCTSYEFQLQGVCTSETTAFSGSSTFITDGCCENPSDFEVTGFTETTGDLDWSAVTIATGYNIRYRLVGAASWTSMTTSNTDFQITGLLECSNYEVQIQTVCNGMQPAFSSSITISTIGCGACVDLAYCTAPSLNSDEEWIASMVFHTTSNNSGNNNGYGDFTNVSTSVDAGSAYPITLTPAFSGQTFQEYFRVWIDYNQDGDFTDSGELAFDAGSLTSTAVNGTITIPANAMEGSTRMRVYMLYNRAPSPCTVGADNFGEIEDYCITISSQNTGPCDPVITMNDDPIADGTYHASNSVFSAGKIAGSSNVIFKAGQQISLEPGFDVMIAAIFEATIENCNPQN